MGIGEYPFLPDWQAEVDEEKGEALLRSLDCEEKKWPQVDLYHVFVVYLVVNVYCMKILQKVPCLIEQLAGCSRSPSL